MYEEIKEIQTLLNHSHDTDPDYFPPELNKIKLHIFQIHASYERSLQILIMLNYFPNNKKYGEYEPLFEQITFDGKAKIVEIGHPQFPLVTAKKLNLIRNEFTHKKGMILREKYWPTKRMHKLYKFLKKAHDESNDFWASWQKSMGKI